MASENSWLRPIEYSSRQKLKVSERIQELEVLGVSKSSIKRLKKN